LNTPKAGNSLKTNTVSQLSPNVQQNKGGYAPLWTRADAETIKLAKELPDLAITLRAGQPQSECRNAGRADG
jgi:hypothetical protein